MSPDQKRHSRLIRNGSVLAEQRPASVFSLLHIVILQSSRTEVYHLRSNHRFRPFSDVGGVQKSERSRSKVYW